jgi:hypothetical protein
MPVKPIPPGLVDSPYNATKPHWDWNGDLEKPTFSPSLLNYIESPGGRRCHSFIKEGRIQFLGDCTHALKGQTVDLLDFPEDEADG